MIFFSLILKMIKTLIYIIKKKKIPSELMINAYLNILFCLSIKNNWMEIILLIKDINKKKIITSKGTILKILLFQLEAYINLKRNTKISETINKIKSHKKNIMKKMLKRLTIN